MEPTPLATLLASFDPNDHPGRIIERVMSVAREHLGLEVSFVSEFDGGQRIFRYAGGDVERFQVRVEGTEPLDETYCQRVVAGTMGPLIPDTQADPVAASFEVTEALGVTAYIGVPVQFSDGRVYATLCCLSAATAEHLSDAPRGQRAEGHHRPHPPSRRRRVLAGVPGDRGARKRHRPGLRGARALSGATAALRRLVR